MKSLCLFFTMITFLISCGSNDKTQKKSNKSSSNVSKSSSQSSTQKTSNKLKSGQIKENKTIQGYSLQKGMWITVDHQTGKLEKIYSTRTSKDQGMTDSNVEVNGIVYDTLKGGIDFYKNGQVERGVLGKDQVIKTIPIRSGEYVSYYEDGKFKRIEPSRNVKINGFPVGVHGKKVIEFYETGVMKKFIVTEDVTINGVLLSWGKGNQTTFENLDYKMIKLYKSGKLKEGVLSKDTNIKGFPCNDEMVEFYENGDLKGCSLTKNIKLKKTDFENEKVIQKEFHSTFKKGDHKRIVE